MLTIEGCVQHGLATVDDLHAALKLAMQLEFATIPPYLCAQWSVVEDPDRVEGVLHAVVSQEMQHFALAGNVLNAIGGRPHITGAAFLPRYPLGNLPGGVNLSRPLALSALTTQQLELFLEIEHPDFPPVADAAVRPSIGAFYDEVVQALETLQPAFDPSAPQVEIPFTPRVVSVVTAINMINRVKQEGEGTRASPEQPLGEDETLAHYYQFKQILRGRRLIRVGDKWEFAGKPIHFPAVCSCELAAGGGQEVIRFRKILSELLSGLERCWTLGTPFSVVEMFQLGREGRRLVRSGITPDFTWLDSILD